MSDIKIFFRLLLGNGKVPAISPVPILMNVNGFPDDEVRVLGIVDVPSTIANYPASSEAYNFPEFVLNFVHRWDGHWEDDELNKVDVVAWIEIDFDMIGETNVIT